MIDKLKVGDVVTVKGRVKYIRTGFKTRDMVCVTIDGTDVWMEMPKEESDGRAENVCKDDH